MKNFVACIFLTFVLLAGDEKTTVASEKEASVANDDLTVKKEEFNPSKYPEFSFARIQTEITQGAWVFVRQSFLRVTTPKPYDTCFTEYFMAEVGYNGKMKEPEVISGKTGGDFCRISAEFLQSNPHRSGIVSVMLLRRDSKLANDRKYKLRNGMLQAPSEVLLLSGYRFWEEIFYKRLSNDPLFNTVLNEIAAVKQVNVLFGKRLYPPQKAQE